MDVTTVCVYTACVPNCKTCYHTKDHTKSFSRCTDHIYFSKFVTYLYCRRRQLHF